MAGFTSLDFMYDKLGLAAMTKAPAELPEAKRAEIEAAYVNLMRQEKSLSRSRVDEYYALAGESELHGVKIPESDDEMRRSAKMVTDGMNYECRVAHYPFSRGGVRAAYFGKLKKKGSSEWIDVVLKEFIFPNNRTLAEYKNQSENSAVAKYMMDQYVKSRSHRKPMRVLPSKVLKLRKKDGSETLYNVEDYLSGTWTKWTNNIGVILDKNTDLLNFSCWSYDRTGGYLMVSDLQGAESSDSISLTDPAVLCKDTSRFGPTNIHEAQMIICLEAARNGVGVSMDKVGGHTMRAGFSLYPFSELDRTAPYKRVGITSPAIDNPPIPTGYVACTECGTIRSARLASIPWLRGTGECCSKCGHSSPSCWLRNLTKEKMTHSLRLTLSNNAKNDREGPSARSCGHYCCRASSYNPFGNADTMMIQMMGGGIPQQRYANQKCCACTGYSAPCTKCIKERMFLTSYLSSANPFVAEKVFKEVLIDFS